jgi:acyl-CoA synthetase (NDP forming)
VNPGIKEQLDPIFKPESVALIGASNNPGKWGGMVMMSLLNSRYRGRIYPVNPRESTIMGMKAYPDVSQIPDDVDLAVFTVPAIHVPKAMQSCVDKGVKGGVVISADFAETGEKGRALEEETVRIARSGGIRFVGPNGNGIFSTESGLSLNPFGQSQPGGLAFVSQSGNFGGQLSMMAMQRGIGMSKFVAMGNQADLQIADYVDYFAQDPQTKVIAVYMEGFKNGRRFFEAARQTVKQKPVLILKGGVSDVGARATLSHTASIAGEDKIFDGLCRQAGLIRVRQLEHVVIMAQALMGLPLPKGNRIAVIGNGGQAVAIIDNLSALGLLVPEFMQEDKIALKTLMPPHAPVPNNPIDFAAGEMGLMEEVAVMEKLASFDYIDGIITNVPREIVLIRGTRAERKIETIRGIERYCRIVTERKIPIITNSMMASPLISGFLKKAGIPSYDTSEQSALAMYALAAYGHTQRNL